MNTPDLNIQTHNVQKDSLPLLDSENSYVLRYRVKTLDGSASTSWSPVYRAKKESVERFFGPGGTHRADVEAKSHGQSFDVSWRIHNDTTDLSETPEQVDGLPLDAYVRWGGEIVSFSPAGAVYTITVNYDHNFFVGQTITIEGVSEDYQQNYTVQSVTGLRTFTIDTTGLPTTYVLGLDTLDFIEIGNRLWSRWEFVATTVANSFSVPIPAHHQTKVESGVLQRRYAEFMVHLATFEKNRQETDPATLIFYSDSVSTGAAYDAGSII